MIFVSSNCISGGADGSLVCNDDGIEVVTEFDEIGFDVEQQQQPPEVFRKDVEHRPVGVNRVGLIVLHSSRIMLMGERDVKYARVAYPIRRAPIPVEWHACVRDQCQPDCGDKIKIKMTATPRPTESLTNRHHEVREHLQAVVDSDEFSGSERRRNLLRHLVEETLAGRGDELNAYDIGLKAIGRPSEFDPQTDPIVRVEVGRLRATLDRYYRARPDSSVVISIPKGRHIAEFGNHENNETALEWPRPDGIRILLQHLSANSDTALQISELTMASLAKLLADLGANVLLSDEQNERPRPSEGPTSELFEVSGSMRTAAGRVRCAVTIHRPGTRTTLHITPVEESLVDQHLFDVADRIAQRVAWILLDDFGVVGRARRSTGATPDLNRYQDMRDALCDAFEAPAPAPLAAASESLERMSATTLSATPGSLRS